MNSGIRALDKSQFVSFAQKLSKNKFQSHSLIKNNPSSKIQTKSTSNLIYTNIIPSKERSKSLNAMMTNVFKQPKQKEEIIKKESNDIENLVSNLDNIESNVKIYESKKRNENSFCSDISDDLSMINKCLSRRDSNNSIETTSDKKSYISYSTSPYSMKIFENLSNRKKNYYNSNETTGPNSTKTSYISNTTNSTINYSNINNTNNNYNNYSNAFNDDDIKDNLYENPLTSHNNNNNYSSFTTNYNLSNNNNYNTFRIRGKIIQTENLKNIKNYKTEISDSNNKDSIKKYYPKIKFSNNAFLNSPLNNSNMSSNNLNIDNNNIEENNILKQSSSQTNLLNKNNNNENLNSTKILNSSSSTSDINKINKNSTVIQLEDLIVLEEKLYHILDNLTNINSLSKLCIEWWSFYTYTSFGGKFEIFFPNSISQSHQIAHENSILELLSIIILYEVIKDIKISQTTLSNLKNLITEIHQNYLITCDYVLSTINVTNENIWINKLQNIILSKINQDNVKTGSSFVTFIVDKT